MGDTPGCVHLSKRFRGGEHPRGILDDSKRECEFGWAQIIRFTQDDNISRIRFSNNLLGVGIFSELLAVQCGMDGRVCARFPMLVPGHPNSENDSCRLLPGQS